MHRIIHCFLLEEASQVLTFFKFKYAEAEAPIFWPSDANSWLIGNVPDAGKDWGQKEKRASEDDMAGWHHLCNGHELGQTLGNVEGQRGLACCSPWGCKESDTTRRLNNNNITIVDITIVNLQSFVSFMYIAKWFSYWLSILFKILFHYMLLQDIEYSSLCYTVSPYCLFYV